MGSTSVVRCTTDTMIRLANFRALSETNSHSYCFFNAFLLLPGTSQLLTLWPPRTLVCHLLVQPPQLKRQSNAKKRSILTLPATIISFPLPLRHSVLLIRSVRTSFLLWAIAFHLTLMTHVIHFFFFNAFLLRFSALMLSASPIHSATLMWMCDVVSRETPSAYFFS